VIDKQRESIAKYLYDLSKGILLAGVIGYFTGNIAGWVVLVHLGLAANAFIAAYLLEGKQ